MANKPIKKKYDYSSGECPAYEQELKKNRFWFKLSFLLTAFVICLCVGMGLVSSAECSPVPTEGCTFASNQNSTLAYGVYQLNGSTFGAMQIATGGVNVTINCNGSTFVGNFSSSSIGLGISNRNNITFNNCNFDGYHIGVRVQASSGNTRGVTLNNFSFTSNFSYSNIYLNIAGSTGSNLTDVNIRDSTFRTNQTTGTQTATIDIFTNGDLINNLLIENSYFYNTNYTTSSLFDAETVNNFTFRNNVLTGSKKVGVNGFSTSTTLPSYNVHVYNNTLTGLHYPIHILRFSENYTIDNNYLYNNDINIFIEDSWNKNILIQNNTIFNATQNFDIYNLGIKVYNSTSVVINSNNISQYGTTGILLQQTDRVNITNNLIDGIPFSIRGNFLADDVNEPQSAIIATELYKTFVGAGDDSKYNATLTQLINLKNTNLYINNNTISNSNVLLKSVGTINISHDFSSFWYIKQQSPLTLIDTEEYFISNNYNNVSGYKKGYLSGYHSNPTYSAGLSDILWNGDNGEYYTQFQISRDFVYIKNLNSSTQNSSVFNKTSVLIYLSNGSVVCSDISTCNGNINITLTPGNYSYVLDNFNLTEGITRQNSPIWISSIEEDSTRKRYNIASNITTNLTNVPIIVNVDCDLVGDVYFTPKNGIRTKVGSPCSNDILQITSPTIAYSTSSNTLDIYYNGAVIDLCSDGYSALSKFFNGLGILFTALVILGALAFIMYKYSDGMDLLQMVLTILLSLSILAIMLLLLINDSTGGC